MKDDKHGPKKQLVSKLLDIFLLWMLYRAFKKIGDKLKKRVISIETNKKDLNKNIGFEF